MRSQIYNAASKPITNVVVDPRATVYNPAGGPGFGNDRWNAYETFTLVTAATDGPPGTALATYARTTCTVAMAGLGFDFGSNPEANGAPDSKWTPAVPGQAYTVSVWVRCSGAYAARVRLRFRSGAGWLTGADYQTNLTLTASQWQRLSVTGVAPAGATFAASYTIINDTMNPGDTFDATGLMIHTGSLMPTYCDGNTPGWKWLGTPGASQSVGYPYGLGLLRNTLTRDLSMGTYAAFVSSTSSGSALAVITLVNDPVPGTAIQNVMDVNSVTDATRAWNTLTAPHNQLIKAGETWTISYYLKSVGGDPGFGVRLNLFKGDGTNQIYVADAVVATAAWQRVKRTFTATADAAFVSTGNRLGNNLLYFTTNDAKGATHYRVGGIQLERGNGTSLPFIPPYS